MKTFTFQFLFGLFAALNISAPSKEIKKTSELCEIEKFNDAELECVQIFSSEEKNNFFRRPEKN